MKMKGIHPSSYTIHTTILLIFILAGSGYRGPESVVHTQSDSGEWKKTSESIYQGLSALISIDSFLVAGTFGGGVFFTTDDGASWTSMNDGLSGNGLHVRSLVFSGSSLYAGSD